MKDKPISKRIAEFSIIFFVLLNILNFIIFIYGLIAYDGIFFYFPQTKYFNALFSFLTILFYTYLRKNDMKFKSIIIVLMLVLSPISGMLTQSILTTIMLMVFSSFLLVKQYKKTFKFVLATYVTGFILFMIMLFSMGALGMIMFGFALIESTPSVVIHPNLTQFNYDNIEVGDIHPYDYNDDSESYFHKVEAVIKIPLGGHFVVFGDEELRG